MLRPYTTVRSGSRSQLSASKDVVGLLFPVHGRAGQAVRADRSGHPVGGDPAHDLGVGEVLLVAAHLPQSVVRFAPG